jgi:hypothetical protein
MPGIGRCKVVQKFASAAIGGVVLLVGNSGIAQAAYGPSPAVAPVPGGFYCIVTSQTVGRGGKLIGPLSLDGLVATLRIGRGTFARPVQITITEPYGRGGTCQGGAGVGDGGFRGWRAVGGVGILVQRDGSAYHHSFGRPFALRLASQSIAASSRIVAWNGKRFALARHAVVSRRLASVGGYVASDFAVLAPAGRRSRRAATTALRAQVPAGDFLAAAMLTPAGSPPPGLGVLAP